MSTRRSAARSSRPITRSSPIPQSSIPIPWATAGFSSLKSLIDPKSTRLWMKTLTKRCWGRGMQSNRLLRTSPDTSDMVMAEHLPASSDFIHRHIGPLADDVNRMLEVVGAPSLEALIDEAIPAGIRQRRPLDFGLPLSEQELLAKMRAIAARNRAMVSLIGQGYYGTHLPPVIQRNVLENPAWYTAYTPYQPEISQGRLEALLNFQTMVIDLTGLEIANASLLDEATAAAESMAMARRVTKLQAAAFFVDQDCHPQTIAVIRTRAEAVGWTVIVGDPATELDPTSVFGALLQYPGSSGAVRDHRDVIGRLHAAGALAIVAADPLALTLLMSPSAQHNGSVSPLAMAARTPRSLRRDLPFSGRCRAASSASASIAAAARPTGWRCKRASSTSAAKKRHRIFVPHRYCRRCWPQCTPSFMVPQVFAASLHAWRISRRRSPAACKSAAGKFQVRPTSTRSPLTPANYRTPFISALWRTASISGGSSENWQSASMKRPPQKSSSASGPLSVIKIRRLSQIDHSSPSPSACPMLFPTRCDGRRPS